MSQPAQFNPVLSKKAASDRAFELDALPLIDTVYQLALSLTGDEARATAVVEDTFLRAYGSWHTHVPGSDCRRWLLALCLDVFLRSRDARPAAAPESGDVDRDEDDASWKPATWSAVLAPRAPIES